MLADLRLAVRRLRAHPAFALAVVLTLGLGLGANAALYTLLRSVLLRPLPYARPERLVVLRESLNDGNGTGPLSAATFRDWGARAPSLAAAAAWRSGSATLEGGPRPERVPAVDATPALFPALGVRPLLGRSFARGDDAPGAPPVVVLSELLWRTRFAADPRVVGRPVRLDGQPTTVIGVMPAAFRFGDGALWRPLTFTPEQAADRGAHNLQVVARLRDDATLDGVRRELAAVAADLARQFPADERGRGAVVLSMRDAVVGDVRPVLLGLGGAVAAVLLVACANVAGLQLARAAARRREFAVRAALGAARGRLVRAALAESALLAGLGAAVAVPVAALTLRGLLPLAAGLLPETTPVRVDGTVFAFLLGAAAATAVLSGGLPAVRAGASDPHEALREGGRSAVGARTSQRARRALVVGEVALALVLVTGAGLLLQSVARLAAVDPGLDATGVLTAHMALPVARYGAAGARSDRFLRPVLARLAAAPGVRAAGLTTALPLQSFWINGDFSITGRPAEPGRAPQAEERVVSAGYFAALGIPLKRGRLLDDTRDVAGAPGALLVNETLARRYFPGADPVGRGVSLGGAAGDSLRATIVGVVGDVRQVGLDQPPQPELYMPYAQADVPALAPYLDAVLGTVTLVIRAAGPPAAAERLVRRAVADVDAAQPVFAVVPMTRVVADAVGDRRLVLVVLGAFAGLALGLAAAGLYAVVAYQAAQRTREIGVRVALGAHAGAVRALVLGEGARLAAAGVVVGAVLALPAARLLRSRLYEVGAADPATFAGAALLFAVVALLASWLPARRAARVDPVSALRAE